MSFFELDLDGIMGILAQQGVPELHARAQQAVNTAHGTGPRGEHAGRHVVDKIAVGTTHATGTGGPVVDIDWPDSRWHLLEFGSIHNPPYRVITNAAQDAGLEVIDEHQ